MNLQVSSSPHIRDSRTTQSIMLDVLIALIPALVASFFIFGYRSLVITAVTVSACVVFEFLSAKVRQTPLHLNNLSAVVTGVLLAYNMPSSIPLWIPVLGALVAIIVIKEMFGGIGNNFANPAIAARIVLLLSFPEQMNNFTVKIKYSAIGSTGAGDLASSATPLGLKDAGQFVPGTLRLFLGQHAGVIGEVCAAALLLGFVYLLVRGVITAWIPVTYVGTVALMALLTGNDPLFNVLTGGLLLGAIFMATDYVTTPYTTKGKIIFGVGCGLITGLIRFFGSIPEGVSYAILVMNLLTPTIDRYTMTKPVGGVKHA
ncbi:RnfABCDGE type electron transport complex subunit D [Proteiniclasticum sp. QWL-01]|uniref:RnfABCDGE type electron transport complex subunit D n=1 Tax=Proteiniclasticum sp. QWL-01 TaxID=3036945 RepID=UPI00240EC6A6|nr:RnfABCDGE type electron transport complex subunit D [Proteiniclasticum sp. QWL-01]WFF72131.1 RnfABCDGE type electron transport complex subunit D [Proteiniclasticum sp. QWL-01]